MILPLATSEETCDRNLILRLPRWGQGQIKRVSATLDYVRQNSSIPEATTVAKDFSDDSLLESPYIIQKRIPGNDLGTLWTEVNHS